MATEKSTYPISLLDFHCFKPPEELKKTKEEMIMDIKNAKKSTWPEAQEESDMIIMDCVSNLLAKTGISAQEVDIVIVSCTCFIPVPSMAARIVNRFRMREDVLTYNLGGMGCSASLVSIDLAKRLLESMPNKLALIISHENITNCYYIGHERKFMLVNCLFRLGGAAALMTNRPADRAVAKYDLKHSVRVHTGRDDECFNCIGLAEDGAGHLGMFLERSVVKVRVLLNPKYVPSFTTAFEHFLIHTGGRGVLDEMEKTLHLEPKLMEPSRAVLWRFGNTSAASTWYILSHLEHNGTMKKGDRIFQLGFGGGFKACSASWTARKAIKQSHSCWLDD
ncbi:hypothetical protein WJX73_008524 [Symbiochloris irregularis]|uniref:very-long-chain 3-oxoacyl-CoA synthase n=1 Tax=Symbiochloris irregularis TaxID=706552 RepID=A0AAW1NNN3_9CHLO